MFVSIPPVSENYLQEKLAMDELLNVNFRAAVAAERESELYEIVNEKMCLNEMKIVESMNIADVCKVLSEILEELKRIHEVLQARDQK